MYILLIIFYRHNFNKFQNINIKIKLYSNITQYGIQAWGNWNTNDVKHHTKKSITPIRLFQTPDEFGKSPELPSWIECDEGDLPPTVGLCQKREKYMQDAKRLARGCKTTDNARGSVGMPSPRKKLLSMPNTWFPAFFAYSTYNSLKVNYILNNNIL